MSMLDFLNYLLIGTAAIITAWGLIYAIYLILLNEEREVQTRNLGWFLIFLVPASFFSGIVFVHYFIEKYINKNFFVDFLWDNSRQIALAFWFGLFVAIFYIFIEKRLLMRLKEELKEEEERIKRQWEDLLDKKERILNEARKKAEEIIQQAEKEREKIIFQAEEEKRMLIEQAKREIEQEKERILSKYKEKELEKIQKEETKEINKYQSKDKEEDNDIFTF